MPKKFMGFDISYLKREYMEPKHSKMTPAQRKHEASETPAHERKEHKAASALMKKLKKYR